MSKFATSSLKCVERNVADVGAFCSPCQGQYSAPICPVHLGFPGSPPTFVATLYFYRIHPYLFLRRPSCRVLPRIPGPSGISWAPDTNSDYRSRPTTQDNSYNSVTNQSRSLGTLIGKLRRCSGWRRPNRRPGCGGSARSCRWSGVVGAGALGLDAQLLAGGFPGLGAAGSTVRTGPVLP